MKFPEVTIAVVSFNTCELLLRCLGSLAGEVDAGRARVSVIDNGSSDGSVAAARAKAPWAEVIEADGNLGFGAAVNHVAARSRSEWLMAANADVALEPGALSALLSAGLDPGVGCVAPRLLLPGGETQQSAHPLPTVSFTIAFNLGLLGLSPRWSERLCLDGAWNPERRRSVPWAIGACLLLRRSAFTEVGGFDERQWMYAEDLDLGWRLKRHGWVTRYEPGARVCHESGASTRAAFGEDPAAAFMGATYAMLLRRRGVALTSATAVANLLGAGTRVLWRRPLAGLGPYRRGRYLEQRRWLRAHLAGFRVAVRGQSGRPAR